MYVLCGFADQDGGFAIDLLPFCVWFSRIISLLFWWIKGTNFDRCGLVDPEIAAKEEAAKLTQLSDEEGEEIRAADALRRYLRNKTVRLIRNVDPNLPTMCHPGHVDTKALRVKLSKQFKIDLEEHEIIHIRNEPVKDLEDLDG